MTKLISTITIGLILVLAMAGCGSRSDQNLNETQASNTNEGGGSPLVLVSKSGDDLSLQGKLALGTLKLEGTELAIDEAQATELLPLWQALNTLTNSDTTATAELNAVVNQIQETMSAAQIKALNEMELTSEGLTAMIESGDLGFGPGGLRGGQRNSDTGEGVPRGFGGGFGGPPPIEGGSPGGGQLRGFGPGGGFGELSEEDRATRQAQFEGGGTEGFQEQMLMRAVVGLLQTKTGQVPAPRSIFSVVFDVISQEAGLTIEEIQSLTAEGNTLAEIIESNSGDVAAVRAALIEALNALPEAAELDVEQLADDWLSR